MGDAMELCREDWIMPIRIFMLISAICMFFCIIMIGVGLEIVLLKATFFRLLCGKGVANNTIEDGL